jgi:hypothetical protein
LTPQSLPFIVDAELNGVPVFPLIDSGAQGCFISYEVAARLHPSRRKKLESFARIHEATAKITDFLESFPEKLITLNGHPTTLEAVVSPIFHDVISVQT